MIRLRRFLRRPSRPVAGVLGAAAAAVALGAFAAPPAVPAYREFKDWVVACDNARRCDARLAPESGDPSDLRLAISRFAGPEGTAQIELNADKPLPPQALQLDGKPIDAADQPGPKSAWQDDGEGGNRLEEEPALRLGRQLAQGRSLTVQTRQAPVRLSLDGLAAALLFMDDVQGRVGTVTAWRDPGSAPASRVPPEPSLPVLGAAPVPPPLPDADAFAARVRSRNAALLAQRCDTARGAPAGMVDQALPLTASEALVMLNCWNGAYQSAALVLRVPRNAPENARPVSLPAVPGGLPRSKADDPAVLSEPFYDPETGALTTYAKGRGIGDCGYALGWVFDGAVFRAASRDEQRRCAGAPGDWPTLYRTRMAPPGEPATPPVPGR